MSRIVFGTGGRFGRLSSSLAHSLVDYAWESGIRTFDTGFSYAKGASQILLHQCLSPYLSNSGLVVTTKIVADPCILEKAVLQSVHSLGRDYLDVVFLWGASLSQLQSPLLYDVMSALIDKKLVKCFGLNTHSPSVMAGFWDTTCSGLISHLMIDYSLVQQDRAPIIDKSFECGIKLWAGTALAQGYLIESRLEQFIRTRSISYLLRSFLNGPTRALASNSFRVRRLARSLYPDTARDLPLVYVLSNEHIDYVPVGMMSRSSIAKNLDIERVRNRYDFQLDLFLRALG